MSRNNSTFTTHSSSLKRIFLSPPHMGGEELKFVKEAFDSNYIAPVGPMVDAFEKEFAEYVGIKHCLALSSGTAAMHLALRLLGVGQRTEDRGQEGTDVEGQKSDVRRENREKELAAQKAEFNIPVFIDSPLGLEITKIYSSLSEYWDKEAKELKAKGNHPIDFEGLYAVERFRDHKRLLEMDGPAIVIAGSGMCTGGRIVNHLKTGIEDARNDIFFVGYQANGTAGRDILKYSKRPGGYVVLDGEKFDIKAKVCQLTGYSAHADQNGLIEWVASMPEKPGRIKLVHGEIKAQKALEKKIEGLATDPH